MIPMTLIHEVTQQIDKKNNIILYNEDINQLYKTLQEKYNSTYITTPKRGKNALEIIIHDINPKYITKNIPAADLLDTINSYTKTKPLIIFINYFEQTTKNTLTYYQNLVNMENIQIIANITEDEKFIDEKFLENFIILGDKYQNNRSNSININYTLLLLISLLVFLLFIRLQLSVIGYLVSALWFTLLMYRSFSYITR